jgi:mono/diheme cytochrome c family protein
MSVLLTGCLRVLVAGLLAMGAYAGVASAADDERAIDEQHPGYPYYRRYCASCHGLFADGKGPVAPALVRQPPDLSRLTRQYGSPLPQAKVAEFIQGETMATAHGRSDMPIWGRTLCAELGPGVANQPARRMIIDQIVAYLASIQVEPTP